MTNQNRTRKKLTVSIGLILVSFVYAFYQNTIPVSSVTVENKPTSINPVPKIIAKVVSTSKPTPAPTLTLLPTPVVTKPAGQYKDGTYVGDPADAYYGTIQVEAIITNGALTDVQFLQHPNDRNTSVRINSRAMPILRQEAISVQSANVDVVSGATDSSGAFQQSIASALTQAKNS